MTDLALNKVQQDLTAARTGTSWDRAEYVGKDGLDTTLGRAALYVKGITRLAQPGLRRLGRFRYGPRRVPRPGWVSGGARS